MRGTYEAVAPGLPRLPVRYDHGLVYVSVRLEVFSQGRVVCVVGQTPDEDLRESSVFLDPRWMHSFECAVHKRM